MSSIKGRNRTFIAISVLLLSFLLILMGNNDVAHAQEGTQELLLPEESVESVVESEATEQTVSDQGVEVELDTEESSGVMDDPLSEETEEVLLGDNLEADSESLEMSEEVMPMFQQSSSFSTFSATAEDVEPEPTSSESAPTPQPASPKAKLEVITGEDGNLYIRDNETNEIRKDNAWVNINGKWYFPNAQGNLYRNRIITFGPSVAYYMNADGSRETNTRPVSYDGKHYIVGDGDGRAYTNRWVDYDGHHYFPNGNGLLYRNQYITFGRDIAHYMDNEGRAVKGFQEIDGNLKYFDRAGAPEDSNNRRSRGYLRKDNAWIEIDNKRYFPNSQGNLYRNQFITFGPDIAYYMKLDGSAAKNEIIEHNSNLYLLGENGVLNKSNAWVNFKDQWYFPNGQGKLYRNQRITFGPKRAHYMGNEGYAVSGVQGKNGVLYYYEDDLANKHPERKTVGWIDHDLKRYFAREGGQLYVNQTITFGPDLAYFMEKDGSMAKELVIDISVHQNSKLMDYDKLAGQVKGVILRVGYTGQTYGNRYYKDAMFETHYQEFKQRNIPVGAYWYSCANTYELGKAEAEFAISLLDGKQFELPIYWDVEDPYHQADASVEDLTQAGLGFLQTMEKNNYYSGIYSSSSWYKNKLNMDKLSPRAVWVAHWEVDKPTYDGPYGLWQFASDGRLDGYKNNLDFNHIYVDYPNIIKGLKMNGF